MNNNLKGAARYSLIATTSFVLFSCTNSIQLTEDPSLPPTSGNIPISISARILKVKAQTRIADNSFEENDEIGLYVLSQPETISGKRHVENKRFVFSAAGFIPDEELFYPKGDGKCDFLSYYPYQEEGIEKSSNTINISIKPNQSSAADYSNSDFMVAKNSGVTPNMKAVKLTHNHKLSQINIILQLHEDENINEIKENASISISNLNTKSIYNIDTELFSSLNTPQSIIPNGEWETDVENHRLTGKQVILIPQATTGCELILRTPKKVYSATLPTDLVLESGTSCELVLLYDSRVGIGKISSSISEWKQGSSSNASLEEKENNHSVYIADLNFERTGVFNLVTSTNNTIGEICKEYLLNNEMDAQAIVLYPSDNKETGTVLQILGENANLHGGTVSWDKTTNSFTYVAGNKAPVEEIFVDKDGNILFEESEEIQQIESAEYVLTDVRGAETIVYPIVKIGTQYWMRENLNTTKYKDASAITNNSAALTKTTAGYYLNNSHRFYNQSVIVTGKIAPQGWKVPDITEWEKLTAYIKNNAATLKTGVWTSSEGIPQATNKTGFNGKPVGIYTKVKDKNEITYGFSQRYAVYWAVKDNQSTPNGVSISLSNTLSATRNVANTEYCAYSIRCIKE